MQHISNKGKFLFIGVALAIAALLRFGMAPISAGPDVAQFWAFAKVFQTHGLDFYRYADASLDIFPFKGWAFVYPPVWLWILRLAWLVVPSSFATNYFVDTGWRIAMKSPIIMADLGIGGLLYWAVPGSKRRKLIFASLWLFHPTAWYESAVFGQFDAIAAAFLLASVILFSQGSHSRAFLFAGLAVMTKQHTFIPVAMMTIISARRMSKLQFITGYSIAGAIGIILSIPFSLTGNFFSYAHSIFRPGLLPGYQYPLCFTFSGSGALLTYLHDLSGWETGHFLQWNLPVMVVALTAAAILFYRRAITPLQGALVGFLLFIGLSYQVHYQYLVVYIPLAILLASRTRYGSERIFALVLAMIPAVWPWLFDISFWFNYLGPTSPWVTPILAKIGLAREGMPDYVYVSLAVLIMCLSLVYVVLTTWLWRPGKEN